MHEFGSLRDYWLKSIALTGGAYAAFVAFGLLYLPRWLNLGLICLAVIQTVITYRRLRALARPAWLVLILLCVGRFGPSVDIGNRVLFFSSLLGLIPVAVAGWPVRSKPSPPAAG